MYSLLCLGNTGNEIKRALRRKHRTVMPVRRSDDNQYHDEASSSTGTTTTTATTAVPVATTATFTEDHDDNDSVFGSDDSDDDTDSGSMIVRMAGQKRPRSSWPETEPPPPCVTDCDHSQAVSSPKEHDLVPKSNDGCCVFENLSMRPVLCSALPSLQADRDYFVNSGCVVTLQILVKETTSSSFGGVAQQQQQHYCEHNDNKDSCEKTTDATVVSPTATLLKNHSRKYLKGLFYSAWEQQQQQPSPDWLARNFLDQQQDTLQDIGDAIAVYQQRQKKRQDCDDRTIINVLGDDELRWWRHTTATTSTTVSLRSLAKLRRLLLPLSVQLVHNNMKVAAKIFTVNHSLMQLWLQEAATESTLVAVSESSDNGNHPASRPGILVHDLVKRLLQTADEIVLCMHSSVATEVLHGYQTLIDLIVQHVRSVESKFCYRDKWIDLTKLTAPKLVALCRSNHCRRKRRKTVLEGTHAVEALRKRAIQDYGNKQRPVRHTPDKHVLITEQEDGVTREEFLKLAHLWQAVNDSMARPFVPFRSRPVLSRLPLCRASRRALSRIFFDEEGRLRRSVVPDILQSTKNSYISFTNELYCGKYDQRWQIPVRPHSRDSLVPSRARVEAILDRATIIDCNKEAVHDLGILVGGTVDQSLHHDICRQFTLWLPDVDSNEEPLLGWEANRYGYNQSMATRWAPSTCLIGMGESDSIFIGVQKDRIERSASGHQCRIRMGRPHEVFDVVRESEHLVVLRAQNGCCFTGDFPHAGVRNIELGSNEERLLNELNANIKRILGIAGLSGEQRVTAVIEMFCSFRGLDKLCRLHCTTEAHDETIVVPLNSIGFTDCKLNSSTSK